MSTVILLMLAAGVVAGTIVLLLDIRANSPQNRGFRPSRARSVVTTTLTILAAGAVVGSLGASAVDPSAMNAATVPALARVLATTLSIALAVVGGGPFAVLALRLATRGHTREGVYGGILIPRNGERSDEQQTDPRPLRAAVQRSVQRPKRRGLFGRRRPVLPDPASVPDAGNSGSTPHGQAMGTPTVEVLRGGTTIGVLERLAIAGAIIAGFPEAIAVVIAIKGVGRFSELAASEAKERFIIGTLASFVWASACALVLR